MKIELFAIPIVGGVIGYITNAIAIKMLFRPYEAVYIGAFRIPFTPGIIPKQRKRIASSIAHVICTELITVETIRNVLLSEDLISRILGIVMRKLQSFENDSRTIQEIIWQYELDEKVDACTSKMIEEASVAIKEGLIEDEIGKKIADVIEEDIEIKIESNPMMKGLLLGVWKGSSQKIKQGIVDNIDRLVEEQREGIIKEELESLNRKLLESKVSCLYIDNQDKIPSLLEALENIYRNVIYENMEKFLLLVDIEGAISSKIELFSPRELEGLLLAVMNKELKAIVYLGALLGLVIGTINMFFLL